MTFHNHAAGVLFLVFLRTVDAARSQLSSECCVADVFRLCEAYCRSLAVWHDRDGERWCRVILWRFVQSIGGCSPFEQVRSSIFRGANWHRLSSDLLRVIRLSLRVYSLVDSYS